MNRDELIQMAKEAGFDVIEGEAAWLKDPEGIDSRIWWNDVAVGDVLQRFASLVAAHERESIAKMADEYATWGGSNFYDWFKKLAAAIRQRGSAD